MKPYEVAVDIGVRDWSANNARRLVRPGARRKETVRAEQFGHRLSIGAVNLGEAKIRLSLELIQPVVLELYVVVIVQAIEPHDFIPARQ